MTSLSGLFWLPFALLLIILPFPHTVAARLLLLLVCLTIAAWQWLRRPGARAAIPCKTAIGLWLVVCLASLAYAVDPTYSLGELKNELGYTMMIFFAFFTVSADRNDARRLVWALAVGFVILGSWGVASWAANSYWNEGAGHGGIGVVGSYLVTIVPAFVWLAFSERSQMARILAFAILAFALLLVGIVNQRAVWVVLAAQFILALVVMVRSGFVIIPCRRLTALICLILAAAIGGLLHSQQARFGNNDDERAQLATDSRLAFWPKVVASIAKNPLVGAGFGRSALRKGTPNLIPSDTPELWHAHNVVLNYGLAMGLPGVLALGVLFGGLCLFFWRASAGPTAAAGIAGLTLVTGVLLRNQFNDFFVRDMSLLFWALVGVFARQVVVERGESS